MARQPKALIVEATKAGLRSAMVELGHQVTGQPETSALSSVVTGICSRCSAALTAVIDYDNDRVTLEGFRAPCGGGR